MINDLFVGQPQSSENYAVLVLLAMVAHVLVVLYNPRFYQNQGFQAL